MKTNGFLVAFRVCLDQNPLLSRRIKLLSIFDRCLLLCCLLNQIIKFLKPFWPFFSIILLTEFTNSQPTARSGRRKNIIAMKMLS